MDMGAAASGEESSPRLPRRGLAGLGLGVAILAGVIALVLLAAPGVIRSQALGWLDKTYHRRARLDDVRLDPLKLRLEADGFSLPDRDGRTMLGFRRLVVALSPATIWRGRLDLADITLEAPVARAVRRADGRINLADLAPAPNKPTPPTGAFSLRIDRVRLRGGEVTLVDERRPVPLTRRFSQIAFSLTDFSTAADGARYSFSAKSDQGEGLDWQGSLGVAPVASTGRFRFTGWQAPALAALAGGASPITVAAGRIDVAGTYRFEFAGEAPRLTVDLARASLKDAVFRAAGADQDWVKLDALDIDTVHVDLARAHVSMGHVSLTGPDVTAILDQTGQINLARFAPPPAPVAARGAAPGPAAAFPAWTIEAPDIRVAKGRVAFADLSAREPVTVDVTTLDAAIAGFAWPIVRPLGVSVDATLDDDSTVTVRGQVIVPATAGAGPSAELDVAADAVDLTRFQPYVSEAAKLRLATGEISAAGHLSLTPAGAVAWRGGAEINDLEAVDETLKSDLVTWDRVTLTDVSAVSDPLAVHIGRIAAAGAFARVVLEPNYGFNIRSVLETPVLEGASASGPMAPKTGLTSIDLPPLARRPSNVRPPPPPTPAIPIDIGQLVFRDGRMDFTDLTVLPHFSTGIETLNGTVTGLSGRPGSRATVDLRGGVDRYAPVTIAGTFNPFDATRFTDIRMGFQNMELTTFSPYSGKFAGYRIDKGKLTVDLHYLIDAARLNATHHVVIDQLELGERVDSADAVKLPIKLIVALLKDRNGVIDLPVDISGSLDDPNFRVWPVIWKVVGNLFDRIAGAPFTLLGKIVGGDGGGERLSHIAFAPGQAALPDAERAKLTGLARALAERPALGLDIPLTVAPDLDGPVLSEARYRAALEETRKSAFKGDRTPTMEAVTASPKLRRRLLEALYRQIEGHKPVFPAAPGPGAGGPKSDPDLAADLWLEAQLRPRFAADDAELQGLARDRALAVQTAMVEAGKVSPRRLFVVTARPLAAGPIEMTLALR
jgi:uncharacterized protein involved in outer membrane biogenesis